jgi:hypothetical protein
MSAVVRKFYLKKEALDKEVTKNSGERENTDTD